MKAVSLWIPGRFKLTNQMLSDLRGEGFYAGFRAGAKAAGGYAKKTFPTMGFQVETDSIRMMVCQVAKVQRVPAVVSVVDIQVDVYGHHKHDPDAWYLLGKAAVDGLTDAAVIPKDRFYVGYVSGQVHQSCLGKNRQGFMLTIIEPKAVPLGSA